MAIFLTAKLAGVEAAKLIRQGNSLQCSVCSSIIVTVPANWVEGKPLHGLQCPTDQKHFLVHLDNASAMKEMRARMRARENKPLQTLEIAHNRAEHMVEVYKDFQPLESVRVQLKYLLGLAKNEHADYSRLKDIIVGVYAAREFEAIDIEFAKMLYAVEEVVAELRRNANDGHVSSLI
ncbi:immunity protein Tsi6 family protein [Undibacterium sp. Dicai25W]|uniref:immunity protein Tsi6 family protein n=1 Tax=Undibacterium sp. Dicai25W TaxID=3413034 RepID=UPI003BF137F9